MIYLTQELKTWRTHHIIISLDHNTPTLQELSSKLNIIIRPARIVHLLSRSPHSVQPGAYSCYEVENQIHWWPLLRKVKYSSHLFRFKSKNCVTILSKKLLYKLYSTSGVGTSVISHCSAQNVRKRKSSLLLRNFIPKPGGNIYLSWSVVPLEDFVFRGVEIIVQ